MGEVQQEISDRLDEESKMLNNDGRSKHQYYEAMDRILFFPLRTITMTGRDMVKYER